MRGLPPGCEFWKFNGGYKLMKRITLLIAAVILCLTISGCATPETVPEQITYSVSKHNDATGKDYEEVQGYTAVLYSVDKITIDTIREWIDSRDLSGGYHQYIYSDPDSWDMYIYYPSEAYGHSYKFIFYISDFCVNINVDSSVDLDINYTPIITPRDQDYILLRIQAPARGAWPSSSRLFIDSHEIHLETSEFNT